MFMMAYVDLNPNNWGRITVIANISNYCDPTPIFPGQRWVQGISQCERLFSSG